MPRPFNLKGARARLHMTQRELGDELGMTGNAIYRMESGDRPVQKRTELAVRYLLLKQRIDKEKSQ